MSVRGNQFKSNSFKSDSDEKQGARSSGPRKFKERQEILPRFDFQDGRFIKIIGLVFIILSLYFLIAFTSYLFTWQEDYSYVIDANGGWSNLFKSYEELQQVNIPPVVQNWLGKFGALLSHQFIYEWFGISSFLFVFVFFVIGYRLLFKVKIFSLEKTLGYSFFFLLFVSLTLGFFHAFMSDSPHYLEGQFGYWSNKLLTAQVGAAGVGGFLVFLGLSVLIIAYNIDFKIPQRKREDIIVPDVPEHITLENEVLSEPVEFTLNDRFANPRKKEQQNIVITPSRFEEKEEDEEVVPAFTPAVNVMHTPPPVAVVPPMAVNPSIELNPVAELSNKPEPELTIEKTEEEKKSEELVEQFGTYDPTLDLASYKYPTSGSVGKPWFQ